MDYINLLPQGFIDDPERGPVYAAAPDAQDDLTQIHGIGEVLEAQLNLNGVYRLEQIASWNQTNIDAFSNMMPCFQDRIERNYWILQAQRIIERRRTSAPAGSAVAGFPAGLIQTVLMLAIALLVGLLFVQWLDGGTPEMYAGNLKARTFHVTATKTGTLSNIMVAEGEQVLEGQQIAALYDSDLDSTRQSQIARVETLRQNVVAAKAKAELDLKWRVHELDREILEHRQAIASAEESAIEVPSVPETKLPPPIVEATVPTRTASVAKPAPARKRHGSTIWLSGRSGKRGQTPPVMRATQTSESRTEPVDVPAPPVEEDPFADDFSGLRTATRPPVLQQISMEQLQSMPVTLSKAEKIRLSEERINELNQLKASLRDSVQQASGLVAAQTALQNATSELKALEDTRHEIVLTTTGFGVCSKVLCSVGEKLQSGQPVLELIDSRNQHVSALIPSKHVDSITPGMKVSLYFPGRQHRRGRINSLPVRTTKIGERGEAMLEIRIEPMGGLWPIVPIGSQVQVSLD
jgi:multidrug resistance efflux pump